MTDLDLRDFTLNDADSWFSSPFSLVDREGKTWNSATNRAWWIAVRGKAKYSRWKGEGTELNTMLKFLHTPPEDPKKVKPEELAAWVDSIAPKKTGAVLGVVINLNYLKKVVEAAPQDSVLIWQAQRAVGDARCLGFECEGWKALLMGHDATPAGLEAFKRLTGPDHDSTPPEAAEEPPKGSSGFDFAMSLGDDDD